jgi:uroporphyrinogen-III synthase
MPAPARVILTQEPADSARLAAKLAALGHEALRYPCVATRLLPCCGDALPSGRGIEDFDVIAFTSKRGVAGIAHLRERIATCGALIACVGDATADAARRHLGATDFIVGSEQTSAGLAEATIAARGGPGALLHVRGDKSTGEFRRAMEGAGWTVEELIVYENTAPPLTPLEDAEGSGAVFSSPTAAQRFFALNSGLLKRIKCIAIGPVTARSLRELGAANITVAERPDDAGVLEAIEAAISASSYEESKI